MEPLSILFLGLALALAFGFEFVNGFHDTANAVATVIYTNTLKPNYAVVWSGLWNLTGVLLSSGAVAYGIVALLPVELVLHVGSGAGFAMVFALLTAAIIWNVGTWYIGIPASSSHTLIGSIVGVGLMNAFLSPGHVFGDGVNWGKVQDTLMALIISPIIGFVASGLLLIVMKVLIKRPELYEAPEGGLGGKPPPLWIRALLVFTCTGVSFAHGSNDGQKGMGLIMLILIGVVPTVFALNAELSSKDFAAIKTGNVAVASIVKANVKAAPSDTKTAEQTLSDFLKNSGKASDAVVSAIGVKNDEVAQFIGNVPSLNDVPQAKRSDLRTDIYLVSASLAKLNKKHYFKDPTDVATINGYDRSLDKSTKFIPTWVKVAVALCLGFGTMIGWKRIVVTVGERIGKAHLTYGQGGAAELVTMATIQSADILGLPVSTTHILSSGVAGAMFANKSGLQQETVRNIILAWVLTLPVCMFLGAGLFGAALLVALRMGSH
jgi:PiT family inorganic phosphate transporter